MPLRGAIGVGILLLSIIGCGERGPRLLDQYPTADASAVPVDAQIELTFDRPIRIGDNADLLTLSLDGQPVAGALAVGEGGNPLVFTPQHFLLAGRSYRVETAPGLVEDLAGRGFGRSLSWSFTVMAGCQIEPAAHAVTPPGADGAQAWIIPGGRRLTPAGTQLELGSFPLNPVVWPQGDLLAVINSGNGLGGGKEQSVQLIDPAAPAVLHTEARPRPGSFFYGLAVSADGQRVYAAGGGSDQVEVFTLTPERTGLTAQGAIPVSGYPAGLLLDDAAGRLYVACQLSGDLVAVDLASGDILYRRKLGIMPYDLILGPGGDKLYVSLWGRSELGQPGQVAVVDPADGSVLQKIELGKNPEDLVLASDGRLFVACADADRVDVIDTAVDALAESWELRTDPTQAVGLSPVALALDENRSRLYVACAQKNSIDVLDSRSGRHLGSIPTGWYPTGVALAAAGDALYVTNGRGTGSGPNLNGEYNWRILPGSLSIIDVPTDSDLVSGADQVRANTAWPLSFYPDRCLGKSFPLPRSIGGPSPIKHVIFVLRENKTYDQNLGDLEGTNGDPSLVMFGESNTPNLHALARRFCNLDNFHAEIEVSVQGHYWNVAGSINDYAEKVWQANYRDDSRLPATGTQQVEYPAGGWIWQKLQQSGIDFRNYGEPMGIVGEYERYADQVNKDYMLDLGLNLYSTPDSDRVRAFWLEVEAGIYPPFVYLALLNDHTYGSTPDRPTPQWMVAENDHATGLLVDLVSHSEHWADTLIIVTEDDPQSGADHVDGHRSIALLISPYTQRGFTSSVHYGFSSLIRTYGLILGMPALNLLDEMATPVYDCFTSQPDFGAYEALEIEIPFETNSYHMPGAHESERMDFSRVDRASGLGQILWLATRPGEPLPPQLLHEEPWQEDEAEEETWELPVPIGDRPPREEKRWP